MNLGLLMIEFATTDLSTPRILVVDDELDIRLAVKTVLEGTLGARVILADSGEAALHLLRTEPVDLVVTDYKMPGMNGVELMAQAHLRDPSVPFVLITAFERELVEAMHGVHEAKTILLKPLNPRPLVQTVQRILVESA